jgi:hypothetical protein
MAQYSRTFTTECPGALLDSVNSNPTITNTATQMIDLGNGTVMFDFNGTLTAEEEAELDLILANWECPDNQLEVDEVIIDDGVTAVDQLWSSQRIHDFVLQEVANAAAGDLTNLIGKTVSVGFSHSSSSVGNSWLRTETNDSGTSSDRNPYIVPFNCRLLAITFSNSDTGVDTDLQIWKSSVGGNPISNKTMVHEIEIRNARAHIETSFSSPIEFVIGDKIGVYMLDRGTNSDHPVVQLTFIVTDSTTTNTGYNFSSDFSSNDDDD